MKYFNCDYHEGAHPKVMERLIETNLEQTPGYGEDAYCEAAAARLRELCAAPGAQIHFLVGGTQTNLTVITAALRPHQGVIAADTGHINVHETGAIENCGHKVLTVPGFNGKLTAAQVDALCRAHYEDGDREHTVQPGMVYISSPTELGTIYSLEELQALHEVCREHGLYLFLDGARLAYGLAAEDNTISLPDLAALCDVFYFGGTKAGALFGEAVVISHKGLQKDFRYLMKQKGAMLAKGRLLGLQFLALLQDELYLEIGRHADRLADKIRTACEAKGYPFLMENKTNQVFAVLPDTKLQELSGSFDYCYQNRVDEAHSAVRFCTSWATRTEDVEELVRAL